MRALTFRAEGAARDVRLHVPPELLPYARCLFPDYQVQASDRGPSTLRADPSPGGGFRVRTPAGAWELSGPSDAMIFLEVHLAETLLRMVPGVRVLHAGGCVVGGGSVVFPGYGGAGKSTLTSSFLKAGVPVLGDDVVLLEPGTGRVRPFKRRLKLPDDSRRRLGLSRSDTPLDALWPGASLYLPSELGGGWASDAPLRHVLFPRRRAGARPELHPVRPAEAVRRLLEQALLVQRPEGADFEAVAAALEGARVHELVYGEAPEAVAFVLGELARRRDG